MFWFKCFILAYTCFLLFLVLSYTYGLNKSKKDKKTAITIRLDEITVVIPFRDENENLTQLLNQIKDLRSPPAKFLFVDDHSSDGGSAIIENNQNDLIELLTMKEKIGKKEAVFSGVSHAKTKYVLCWDADITFSESYFKELSTLAPSSLTILPVSYKSKGFFEWFFEVDVTLANYINHANAGIHRSLICSGANLLVEKESYLEVISLDTHKHIASGDDAFLLRNMQKANKSIELGALNQCEVTTPNPSSIRTFIEQRSRWFGKTFMLKDKVLNTYGLIQLIFALSFFLLMLFLFLDDPILCLKFWFAKSLIETVLLLPFFYALNKTKLLTILSIYGLLFPIYNIILLISLFGKKEWKGRTI